MDKDNKLHINDDIVINKSYYDPMAKELICSICKGLLIDPVLCTECEHPFCSSCIGEWTKKNNQCIMKCKGTFKSKPIPRMIRNIMEKVLIKCNICNGEISLTDYPNHYKECVEKTKQVNCPFCKDCTIKKGDINDKDLDLSLFPSINKQLAKIKQENNVIVQKLKDTIKQLEEENTKQNKDLSLAIRRTKMYLIFLS